MLILDIHCRVAAPNINITLHLFSLSIIFLIAGSLTETTKTMDADNARKCNASCCMLIPTEGDSMAWLGAGSCNNFGTSLLYSKLLNMCEVKHNQYHEEQGPRH
jgi:hypothetical protein